MSHRAHALAALLRGCVTGYYTPFLRPVWDEREHRVITGWRRRKLDTDFPEQLKLAVSSRLGGNYYVKPTNSGRSALQVALEALQLPARSEVLLPAYACTGVIMPVIQAGHVPVLVDVDRELNISLSSIAEAANQRVRAIIMPHLAGLAVADAQAIVAWAREREVRVIEDVAQSCGLVHSGRRAGTIGDVAVFSSGGGKPLFGPGGGWVATRDVDLIRRLSATELMPESSSLIDRRVSAFIETFLATNRVRSRKHLEMLLRGYARRFTAFPVGQSGGNLEPFRFSAHCISGVEAGIAIGQMEKIDSTIQGRSKNAATWRNLLSDVGFSSVRLPPADGNTFSKLWLQFEGQDAGRESQLLKSSLWRCGVEVESLYVPLHLRAPFAGYRRASLIHTEKVWRTVFCVPARPNLSDHDWSRITAALSYARRQLRMRA